jgi:hypothetical protein
MSFSWKYSLLWLGKFGKGGTITSLIELPLPSGHGSLGFLRKLCFNPKECRTKKGALSHLFGFV